MPLVVVALGLLMVPRMASALELTSRFFPMPGAAVQQLCSQDARSPCAITRPDNVSHGLGENSLPD